MSELAFSGTLHQTGNNTGIPVPEAVLAALPSRRAAVKVTVNGYTFHSTIGAMGGQALIPFSAAHRQASGISGGDAISVKLEPDSAPPALEMPADLAAALDGSLQARFDALAPSKRKAHVQLVLEAKTAETRQRRIEKVVASLG